MISKELFVEVIGKLENQYRKDVGYMEGLSGVLGFEGGVLYDNSELIKSVISLLRVWFPIGGDGFCEISHYCNELNFGYVPVTNGFSEVELEYESPEELYDRLTKEKTIF